MLGKVRYASLDMANENLVKRLAQVWDSHLLTALTVGGMRVEELGLVLDSLLNRNSLVNLELRAAFDAKIAKLERVDRSLE